MTVLSSKKDKIQKEEINTLLGVGTEFQGKLTFDGAVRIDGKFSGEIQSSGMLIIGEKAMVQAEIQAEIVLIYGEAHGKISAQKRIEAYAPAKIYGHIYTPIIVFGEGVIFQGTSHMTEEIARTGEGASPRLE
ncbi:MAG: polymer-forming cytoskeletal protein [Deltaproteobacteria bacterium]|nr:polymer-forming cytoskeletal protein [Deltaproteobacteria bacterium]